MTERASVDAVTNADLAKGAGTTLLARLAGVVDVVAQPLYVWMFGLATFGIYAVLWSAVNLIENFADLGMTSALQRTVPQARTRKDAASALRAALILGVTPCLGIAVIVSMLAPSIQGLFNAAPEDQVRLGEAIRVFVWALPLWAFVEIATSALRAQRAFGPEIRLRLFWEQITRLGFAALFWASGMTTLALFYAHLASLVIICILSVRLLARHFDLRLMFDGPVIDKPWADTLKAGLAVLPYNIVARLFGDAPQLILNALLPGAAGATAAGLYIIARKVSSIVQLVKTAFSYVMAPLASLASANRRDDIRDIYAFATRVSLAIVLPLGATMAAGSDVILNVFGTGAYVAMPALIILIAARVIEAIFGNAAPIQQVIGGYKGQLVGSIVGLGAAMVTTLVVGLDGGLTGIAFAVAVGLVTATLVPLWQIHHYDGLHPFAAPFGRVVATASLIALVALMAGLSVHVLPIVVQLPALAALLICALWLTARFALPAEDREALGRTGRRMRLTPPLQAQATAAKRPADD